MASNNSSNTNSDNHLELLLFNLDSKQKFGINVLKVNEVLPCPSLNHLPDSHPSIRGVATLRGESMPVIDLSQAIGCDPFQADENGNYDGSVIITEFNRTKQGLLIHSVDRIVMREWKDVLPPPAGLGSSSFVSGVTEVDDALVQILDVERVMGELNDEPISVNDNLADELSEEARQQRILVVDDSVTARGQTIRTLEQLHLDCVIAKDGQEALDILRKTNAPEADASKTIGLIVSDIEMPVMDGYTLTSTICKEGGLQDPYILLHTSLNGAINTERARSSGADAFLTKFVPEDLAREVVKGLLQRANR